MQAENRIKIDKLVHTRETILSNIALQKDNLAEQGKRMVDLEMMIGASVALIAFFCFNVQVIILKHLLFLLFTIVVITILYIFRVSRSFTRLEREMLYSLDFKIETLKKDIKAVE